MRPLIAQHQCQREPFPSPYKKLLDISERCPCQSRADYAYYWQISDIAFPPKAALTASKHALQEPLAPNTIRSKKRPAGLAHRAEHASAPSVLHTIKPTGDKNAAAA
ncbi:hypothetical protein [Nitrogeniibacter aestuarii]|uniref:hypothetical protein n=1 Tax=Nitrogeniibacter aestuarii TaxID=2815343 RepID=UPI001E4EBAF3|nr:hypothetical protein [Nitrogeniibacter aestuarii]